MWASSYLELQRERLPKTAMIGSAMAHGLNNLGRARGNAIPLPFTSTSLPWGATALGAGGALVGALGHHQGHAAVKETLEDAGSSPSEIARADYLAGRPKDGYGFGSALTSGVAGAAAGLGTSFATQRFLGVNPAVGRGLGLVAGLGAAYGAAKHRSEGDERERLKGALP